MDRFTMKDEQNCSATISQPVSSFVPLSTDLPEARQAQSAPRAVVFDANIVLCCQRLAQSDLRRDVMCEHDQEPGIWLRARVPCNSPR